MLHSRRIRQTVDGKPDVIYVDESRTVKFEESAGKVNGRQHCRYNVSTFCHPPQRNLERDVTQLLKCLTQGGILILILSLE